MAYGASSNSGRSSSVSKATTKPLNTTTKPLSTTDILNGKITSTTGFVPPVTNFRPTQNDEQLILNREVFDKTAFNNTVDTNFTELGVPPPDLSFFDPNLATINDFFNIYQNLFYQIPKFGDVNSHEYLVRESTAYSRVIENQDQIDALIEEITDLREQNLQLQLDINELLGISTTLEQAIQQTNTDGANLEDLLQQEANLGAEQSNSSSDPSPLPGNVTLPGAGNTIGGIGGVGGTGSGIGIGGVQIPNFIIQSGAGAAEGLDPTLSLSLQEQQGGIPTVGMNNVIPINVGSPIY
tara:strand:+ start:35 stop:922 length:888 start_codon:yes stop_codon:yes gene_type:complete